MIIRPAFYVHDNRNGAVVKYGPLTSMARAEECVVALARAARSDSMPRTAQSSVSIVCEERS